MNVHLQRKESKLTYTYSKRVYLTNSHFVYDLQLHSLAKQGGYALPNHLQTIVFYKAANISAYA